MNRAVFIPFPLSITALALQQQSSVISTELLWLVEPQIFTIWPLIQKNVC